MNSLEDFVDKVNALPPVVVDEFYVATPSEAHFTSDPDTVQRFFENVGKIGIETRTYVRFLSPPAPRKLNRRERRAST